MTTEPDASKEKLSRRSVLAATAVGIVGASALGSIASAKPGSAGPPCHKDFECEDGETYVKFDFVIEYDIDGNPVDWYFEEETETGLVTIDSFEGEYEPTSVQYTVDSEYEAEKLMAYGGRACDMDDDPTDGEFEPELTSPGGDPAAISNLQFCLSPVE